jgi:hypothetical protein
MPISSGVARFRTAVLLTLGGLATPPLAAQAGSAVDGRAVLQQMHDAYAGKWYRTLTFVQRTIITRSGKTDTTTWYESVRGPVQLRIDFGPPAAGNGAIFNADSTIVVRNGAVTRVTPDGNPFLPLIMGVYLQPVDETVRQVKKFGVDLSAGYRTTWDERPVLVVGAASEADSTSAQFWIDADRKVLVRMRGAMTGTGGADVRLFGYARVGAGWLATRVQITSPRQSQTEEYSAWKANVPLSAQLFDPLQWKTARHWAPPRP